MARPGEEELIARHLAPLATHVGAWGLKDDAATYRPPAGHTLVLTHDTLVARVHFFPTDPPDSIAAKALLVNLSDLAAKTARPVGYLLSLGLPPTWTEEWLARFCAGLAEVQKAHGLALFGGDTVKVAKDLAIGVTMFGTVPEGAAVPRRTEARSGDLVCVTGTIGGAALGLRFRLKGEAKRLGIDRWPRGAKALALAAYLRPRPPVGALDAVRALVTASMDVSDGLVGDLGKLCRASGVGAVIEAERVPFGRFLGPFLFPNPGALAVALDGGDDYQTLFTCRPDKLATIVQAAEARGTAVSAIGRIVVGQGVTTLVGGRPLEGVGGGYRHF